MRSARTVRAVVALTCLACGGGFPSLAPSAGPPIVTPRVDAGLSLSLRDAGSPETSAVDTLFERYTRGKSPGCAVGVFRAGDIVFAKTYGYADIEHDLQNTTSTVFDLASAGKQFTAATVALLALDGKLSLDDDVRKYVPELPDYGAKITLRHLAHHTSGIRDYSALLKMSGDSDSTPISADDVLLLLSHQRAVASPPGTEYAYSNSNYFLLAIVVERVTGRPLLQVARERIFTPLGMNDTQIRRGPLALVAGRAVGYEPREDGTWRLALPIFGKGAGWVQTTLADLARWDANFYVPKIGGQPFVDMMRTRGTLNDGTTFLYAMGLAEDQGLGRHREWHPGSGGGYAAEIARYPDDHLTAAVLCNDGSAGGSADDPEMAEAVAAVFLPKRSGAVGPPSSPPTPTPVAGAAPGLFVGTYGDMKKNEFRDLQLDGGVLKLRFFPGGPFDRVLIPLDAHTCLVKGTDTRYVLEPASRGHAAILRREAAGYPVARFDRIEILKPTAKALSDYAGRYSSDELLRDMQFVSTDGQLLGGPWGGLLDAPLTPLARDGFFAGGVTFRFERDARGRINAVVVGNDKVSGLRLRKQ